MRIRATKPTRGDERKCKQFALWPTRISRYKLIWLEHYIATQRYYITTEGGEWVTISRRATR